MEAVSVDGLANFKGALGTEPVRKGFRKHGWNVLDDRDAGQAGREVGQDFAQRFGASGGSSQENDLSG